MFPAERIADTFLYLAHQDHKCLTPLQLQKLVYYAHGWHLGLIGEPLLDEQVEAWEYGPVIGSLYQKYKQYGSGNISGSEALTGVLTAEDGKSFQVIKRVWDVYGKFTGLQLSTMTHAEGTPWKQTVDKQIGGYIPRGTDIPSESIAEYFGRLAGKNRERNRAESATG